MKKIKTKKIALFALLTAVITASAWISIPMPSGINLTFTLFGVCASGFLLGVKGSLAATITYILIGAVGLPVFSNFTGGIEVVLGPSGGFLWGFLFTAALCGVVKTTSKKAVRYLFMVLSIILCHIAGVIQFTLITGNSLWVAFVGVSLPFFLKDILLAFIAEYVSKKIKI